MKSLHDLLGERIRLGALNETHVRNTTVASKTNRVYECESRGHARQLVNELMELQDRTHHCSRITCEGCRVILDVWTQGGMSTELDEEYASEADIIFEDARYWR